MIWIIGGTSEAREFAEGLDFKTRSKAIMTTATEGAKEFIPKGIRTVSRRMNKEEMKDFILDMGINLICDFSHPFAEIVSENAREAAKASGVKYLRYEREGTGIPEGAMAFSELSELTEFLKGTEGNVLITTGSKNAKEFAEVSEGRRFIYRVLPELESIRILKELNVPMKDIIAAAGPFSAEMNSLILKEYGCKYLVTKETGKRGGFPEKIEAALASGAVPLVLKRKDAPSCFSMEEIKKEAEKYIASEEIEMIIENKPCSLKPFEDKKSSISNKKAVLVVSFGSTHEDTLALTVDEMEKDAGEIFMGYDIKRAFTSGVIRKILSKRGMEVKSPEEALLELKSEGYSEVIMLPFIIMPGKEYDGIRRIYQKYQETGGFNNLTLGKPLLYSEEDFFNLSEMLKKMTPELKEGEATLFMGHGSYHPGNACFSELQYVMREMGYEDLFIGTVEGFPELKNLIPKLKERRYKKVHLFPLMIVAGDHAKNDMAGDEDDSWKNILKNEGFEVEIHLKGLGESKEIRTYFTDRIVNHSSSKEMGHH